MRIFGAERTQEALWVGEMNKNNRVEKIICRIGWDDSYSVEEKTLLTTYAIAFVEKLNQLQDEGKI